MYNYIVDALATTGQKPMLDR